MKNEDKKEISRKLSRDEEKRLKEFEILEQKMKEEGGMSSRCIPFAQEHLDDVCAVCGKPAKHMIYWGVAY